MTTSEKILFEIDHNRVPMIHPLIDILSISEKPYKYIAKTFTRQSYWVRVESNELEFSPHLLMRKINTITSRYFFLEGFETFDPCDVITGRNM